MGWSLAAAQSDFDRSGRCGDGSRVGFAGFLGRALAAAPFPTSHHRRLKPSTTRSPPVGGRKKQVRPDVRVSSASPATGPGRVAPHHNSDPGVVRGARLRAQSSAS